MSKPRIFTVLKFYGRNTKKLFILSYLLFLSQFYESCQNNCLWIMIFGYFWGQTIDSCQLETNDVLTLNTRFCLKQLIKMPFLCNCFQSWWAKILLVHMGYCLDWKKSFCMYKIIVILSGWIVKNGDLNFFKFLSLTLSYFGGIQDSEPFFKHDRIGLGVQYFDAMRSTVTCFKCYQKVT